MKRPQHNFVLHIDTRVANTKKKMYYKKNKKKKYAEQHVQKKAEKQ